MTDPMDELLNDAGRRWRAGQPPPPDLDALSWPVDTASSRRRWVPALAAAAVTVIAAGAAFILVSRSGHDDATPAGVAVSAAQALVVHDGDTAQASGTVLAVPGQPIRFCAPALVPLSDFATAVGAAAARCRYSVEVTGVDLTTLDGGTQQGGFREGSVHLVGVFRSGVLTVTQQGPAERTIPSFQVPCPAPPGGWLKDPDNTWGDPDRVGAMLDYIQRQHPEQFRAPWAAYPGGNHVYVVEVVKGDVEQARRELRSRYAGNLCVVASPGRPSLADHNKIQNTVGASVGRLMDDPTTGIYGIDTDDTETVRPEMIVLSPQLYHKLAAIGFAHVAPDPWLRPTGS